MSKAIKGHIRLTMKFSKPLAETINMIIYGKFPETLRVVKSELINGRVSIILIINEAIRNVYDN